MTANAGYHAYATGDVLTAAQVQYNLQNQTVMYFATTSARTTAIGSVTVEGMVTYIPANGLEYYNGTAWTGVSNPGDITDVLAGKGLTGGGTSGSVTLALGTTAKGDLVAGTGTTTAAALTVGNNGETLVANSSTSTGLGWNNAVTVNYCINGGADIWQRGTSFTIAAATPSYTADRWTQYFGGTGTVAQETTTVPSGSQYAIKMTSTSTNAGIACYQLVEYANVAAFAGKTVTLSYQAAGTIAALPTLYYSTTANDSLTNCTNNISATSIANPAISTSLQQYSLVATIPSTAKTLRIGITTGSVVNTNYVIFGNVQLEIGSINTRFQRSGGTIQGELAACQRYYQRITPSSNTSPMCLGYAYSTTVGTVVFPLKTSMRVAPTSVEQNAASTGLLWDQVNASIGVTAVTLNTVGPDNVMINCTVASGLTQYRPYVLIANTSGYLGISAEL